MNLPTLVKEYTIKIMDEKVSPNLRHKIARVVEHAEDIFGKNAQGWLMDSNEALGDITPISLFGTEIGIEQVDNILGRIEHGIF